MENPINSKILATAEIYRNLSSDQLYQAALDNGEGRASKYKALVVTTGDKTGRSANDKFFVKEKNSSMLGAPKWFPWRTSARPRGAATAAHARGHDAARA